MLQNDLARQGVDLSIDSTLVYFDVANRRVGVNTTTPNNAMSVNGNVNAQYYFGYVVTADQPFITNVGTLGNLIVAGNLTVGNVNIGVISGNNISVSGNITAGNITSNLLIGNTVTSGNIISNFANLGNLYFYNTTITSNTTNANIYLVPTGTGIVNVSTTTALAIPSGNTAQEPADVPSGSLRYNTDSSSPEFFNGNSWVSMTSTVSYQTFTGNGTGNTYPLTQTTTTGGVLITLNGVQQTPGVAYNVSGNAVVFSEIPASTDTIDVRYITTGQSGGLSLTGTVPATSTSAGTKGQVVYDSSYVYICVNTNTWIRANIQSTF